MKSQPEFFDNTMQELLTLLKRASESKDIVVQSRAIISKYWQLKLDENNKDFLSLVALDSDTDHLPKGSVRDFWNKEALLLKDLESKEFELTYRADFLNACENMYLNLSGLVD